MLSRTARSLRLAEVAEDVDDGGFAGAIGPEQTEDLAAVDAQAERIEVREP
jgi:hypothetical protein